MKNRQKIYIIDDELQTAMLFSEYAKLIDYEAAIYTNAIDFFSEPNTYPEGSIMLLDLNMPEMDGIEVMRRMVETGNLLPLILVSGYDTGVLHSAEQLARACSLEIIATIKKPFDFETFKSIMASYKKIERRQHARSDLLITAAELKDGIRENQLILHYQPQLDMKSGELIGVEALVRWQHPQHGLVYPDSFINLAESNGLIGELTSKVIELAIQQTLRWKNKGLNFQIAINISAENIRTLSLPEQLTSMLNENELDPSLITLEITESTLMGQLVTSLDILTRLRMKGIKLSIDDFGTGYSSLSQLYRMPFTELKIDLSFVMNIIDDEDARGIVKTCIILGHELKMQVVAEGVESKEIYDMLNSMDCDIAQGYYIAKPMSADDLTCWEHERLQQDHSSVG